jgi:hypothetical protein
MKEIKKFEFCDLSIKESPEHEKEIVIPEVNDIHTDEALEAFADQNSLEEVGQTLEPLEEIRFMKITKEELDDTIAKAKETAIAEYIGSQPVLIEEVQDDSILLDKISSLVTEIKNRVDIEFEVILERFLQLSYVIAAKVIDIQLMNISQDNYISLIRNKIQELGFHGGIQIEVKDEKLAHALTANGIEVLINDDMLAVDYKIVWCNGFLERKTSDIISQIEEILIEQIRK